MKLAFEIEVIIAIVTAFFSIVCEQTVAAHPRMIELTPYVPRQKIHMATYRPAVLVSAGAKAKPRIATALQPTMCHDRSFHRPEVQETNRVPKPAIKYGGQV